MNSSTRRHLTVSLVVALTLGALSSLPAAGTPHVHLASIPTAAGPWFDRLNSWRASAGLPLLTEDSTFSQGDYDHAVYMVMTGQVTHSESTLYPAYYTTAGDIAAQNSNIFVSSSTATTDPQAIDWWMGAPFHAMAMMDPRLATTGFGSYRNSSSPSSWQMGAALNVGQGMSATPHYPVYFPGNLSTEPLTSYSGNESPNPQIACPGYTGLPVFVEVGANVATVAGAHTMTGGGSVLNTCVIDSSNTTYASYLKWRGAVMVMPSQPLQNGITYTVAITVNNVPYTWSFTVGPLLSKPGAPANVTATAGDATATVTWTPPADNGSAITSYSVTPYIGTIAQTPQTVTAPASAAVINGLTNGTTYWYTVAATNSIGTGQATSSNSITPTSSLTPPARDTALSVRQYSLPNSDGVTWQDMDAANLSLSVTPATDTLAIVSANADLWTANAGFNQDIGIWESPTGTTDGIVAWKESGGRGGTYSPNAAAVQTVVSLTAGVTYSFKVRWKTNRSALGATIYAGAGPLPGGGGISPTRLTIQLAPASSVATAVSSQQYSLASSDGATWQPLDRTNLAASLSPGATSTVIVSGNADLWTANPGFNQDFGIFVSVNGGADQLVAWKESGGSAGTYSPNAAFVEALYDVSAGNTYVFTLKWKTNKNAPGATIFAGAGAASPYSPTRLIGQIVPANHVFGKPPSTQQYSLSNSDGSIWSEIDTNLRVSETPTATATVVLGAGADLWTANAGYNQDLGIFASVDGGPDQLVAWKESGGFAGTFSPNAAFVQAVYDLSAGSTYVFKLKWKANRSAPGATIYAGAGPIGGFYSPTSLTAQVLN